MLRFSSTVDIPQIAIMKHKMFAEVGMEDILMDGFIGEVIRVYSQMYENHIAQHFIIEEENEIVACAGAFIKDDIPYCFYKERRYGFIGDVYVNPEHRRQGHARKLTLAVLEWFVEQRIKTVRLLASHDARRLYQYLGFDATDQMVMSIPDHIGKLTNRSS